MPQVVSFDPISKIISEISSGGNNSLGIEEIYSDWKDWSLLSDNLKYPPAFRVIGGDQINDQFTVGTTYFLINGWRIKPAELDHKLEIIGNLYSEPSESPIFSRTIGNYNVFVSQKVSNLIDIVTVSGANGIPEKDKNDIVNDVVNDMSVIIPILNQPILNDLKIIKGLLHNNFRFKNQIYDSEKKLTSGKMFLYANNVDCNNDVNPIAVFSISSEYDDKGNLIDYKVVNE